MGLSVIAFAELFGVDRDVVYLWEKGRCHPRYKTLVEMNRLRNELERQAVSS